MSNGNSTTKADFLNELTELIRKHNASIYYTTDDDGVHIEVDGENVFTGLIDCGVMHPNRQLI